MVTQGFQGLRSKTVNKSGNTDKLWDIGLLLPDWQAKNWHDFLSVIFVVPGWTFAALTKCIAEKL